MPVLKKGAKWDVAGGVGVRAKEQIRYWEQHGCNAFVVTIFICLWNPVE